MPPIKSLKQYGASADVSLLPVSEHLLVSVCFRQGSSVWDR